MPLTSADTRTLIRAVETLHRPSVWLLDTFFPELVEFDTESIDFDVISKGRKLAPYVHPDLPGKNTRTGGYETKSFTPAYVKPKETVKPKRAMRRRPGEAYMGEMSSAERLEAITLDILDEQRTAVLRRKEQQAAEALDTGQIVVEGEDYPRQVVDFGRKPELTTSLSGASRWGESGVNILKSIQDHGALIQKYSGIAPTEVILDPEAADVLTSNAAIRELLDNRNAAPASLELGPVVPVSTGAFLGNIGRFRFWLYQDFYEQADGSDGQMLPDFTCIITSPALEGVQAHGAIEDADLGLVAAEYAPKVWNEKDPSARIAMTQSAPLMVPTRINHSARIRVR